MIRCSTEHIRNQDGQMQHLREELTFVTEEMKKHVLEKEVLQQEKAELNETLSRTELAKAEGELSYNKLKKEEAALRDALLKMQVLNEGLGQDKIELNKVTCPSNLAQAKQYLYMGMIFLQR